ncbi:uncharacterized protein [Symphalangus syndactylus]|uniref:uncharacterized protein n=1 Tax=Symphalangus syndactylus TaxID=9590 RepID=UPI00300459DC
MFGDDCHQLCDYEGENFCHPKTEKCLCPPGRTGARCDADKSPVLGIQHECCLFLTSRKLANFPCVLHNATTKALLNTLILRRHLKNLNLITCSDHMAPKWSRTQVCLIPEATFLTIACMQL